MSGAAQLIEGRGGFLGIPPRTAAALRHLALRGTAVVYLSLLVALPVAAVLTKGFGDGLDSFQSAMARPGARAAMRLTLWTATIAAGINAVMGTMLA